MYLNIFQLSIDEEVCGRMWFRYNGECADINCQKSYKFICERSVGGAGKTFPVL